jgi:hypothetical protein
MLLFFFNVVFLTQSSTLAFWQIEEELFNLVKKYNGITFYSPSSSLFHWFYRISIEQAFD